MSSVVVSIVNYRGADLAIDLLESLSAEIEARPHADWSVTVVDNASGDDSAARIRVAIETRSWSWAKLIESPDNGGYGAGNNVAILDALGGPSLDKEGAPDYVLVLNADMVARAGAIGALVDFMDAHDEVGIVGSRLEDPDATPQHSRYRFPSAWTEFTAQARLAFLNRLRPRQQLAPPISDDPHRIDWVAGASMLVRSELLRRIGLFDERYFMYYEETDLCRRAAERGWACWYVPQSRMVHFVGLTSGVTVRDKRPKRRPAYWFESRRRYFASHHGIVYAVVADLCAIAGMGVGRIRDSVRPREGEDPPHLLGDLVRHSIGLGGRS